jgi:hypothetical protein
VSADSKSACVNARAYALPVPHTSALLLLAGLAVAHVLRNGSDPDCFVCCLLLRLDCAAAMLAVEDMLCHGSNGDTSLLCVLLAAAPSLCCSHAGCGRQPRAGAVPQALLHQLYKGPPNVCE